MLPGKGDSLVVLELPPQLHRAAVDTEAPLLLDELVGSNREGQIGENEFGRPDADFRQKRKHVALGHRDMSQDDLDRFRGFTAGKGHGVDFAFGKHAFPRSLWLRQGYHPGDLKKGPGTNLEGG